MVIVYILKESNVPIKDLIVKDDNKIYREIFFALLLVLSVVGLIISIFIINLRLDSVLYARTVNGVRNYFYNCSHLSTAQINQIKVLPVNIKVPSYFEWMIFLPIVSAFALINSSYMLLSFFILKKGKLGAWLIIISVLFLILHLVIYYLLCYYRENAYLIQ
jgi:heme/copper-type cytochrome/quinol oxidase subunit 4